MHLIERLRDWISLLLKRKNILPEISIFDPENPLVWKNILKIFRKKSAVMFYLYKIFFKTIFLFKSCNFCFNKNIIVLNIWENFTSQMSGSNCKVNSTLYGGNHLRQKAISKIRHRESEKKYQIRMQTSWPRPSAGWVSPCPRVAGLWTREAGPGPALALGFVVSQWREAGLTRGPGPEAGIRCQCHHLCRDPGLASHCFIKQ